jgi:hypothetical protein
MLKRLFICGILLASCQTVNQREYRIGENVSCSHLDNLNQLTIVAIEPNHYVVKSLDNDFFEYMVGNDNFTKFCR